MARPTFQELLLLRNELLHKVSVWEEVVSELRRFIDTDTTPAKTGITTKGSGLVVPQEIINSVITDIEEGPIAELLDEVQKIENREVAENVRKKGEAAAEGKAGRKAKGGPTPTN